MEQIKKCSVSFPHLVLSLYWEVPQEIKYLEIGFQSLLTAPQISQFLKLLFEHALYTCEE